jgi:hypothetical protein
LRRMIVTILLARACVAVPLLERAAREREYTV